MDISDWEKWFWAIGMGMMIWFLIPKSLEMIRRSRQASTQEWLTFVLPLTLVAGFVILLIMLVRKS